MTGVTQQHNLAINPHPCSALTQATALRSMRAAGCNGSLPSLLLELESQNVKKCDRVGWGLGSELTVELQASC